MIAATQSPRFSRYSLDFLPVDTFLVLDQRKYIVSLLDENTCMPVAQERLTGEEIIILSELLGHYPYFCPYEALYSVCFNVPVDEARETLQAAYGTPDWQYLMHPLQNNASRARAKLRPLGIEIKSMIDTGYMLSPVSGFHQRNERTER